MIRSLAVRGSLTGFAGIKFPRAVAAKAITNSTWDHMVEVD
jgi:hypothetical protein